jgi:hypothetical protein
MIVLAFVLLIAFPLVASAVLWGDDVFFIIIFVTLCGEINSIIGQITERMPVCNVLSSG